MFDSSLLKIMTRLLFVIFIFGLFSRTRGGPLNITDITSDDPLMPFPVEDDDDMDEEGSTFQDNDLRDSQALINRLDESFISVGGQSHLLDSEGLTQTEVEPATFEMLNNPKSNPQTLDQSDESLGEESDFVDLDLIPTEIEKEPAILEMLNNPENNSQTLDQSDKSLDQQSDLGDVDLIPNGINEEELPGLKMLDNSQTLNQSDEDLDEQSDLDDMDLIPTESKEEEPLILEMLNNPENNSQTRDQSDESLDEQSDLDNGDLIPTELNEEEPLTLEMLNNPKSNISEMESANDPFDGTNSSTDNQNMFKMVHLNKVHNMTNVINEDTITDDNSEIQDPSTNDAQISPLKLDGQEQSNSVESIENESFKEPSPPEIDNKIIPETLPTSEMQIDTLNLDSLDTIPSNLTNELNKNNTDDKTFLLQNLKDQVVQLTQGVAGSIEIQFNNEQGIFKEVDENELDVTDLSPISITSFGGQCPPMRNGNLSEACLNSPPSTCWTSGSQDADCIEKGGLCCNDGCGNYCLDEVLCQKVLVNETQIIDKEVEICSDVPGEVCKEILVKECEKDCKVVIESVEVLKDVEECHLEQDEICKQKLTTICKDEEIPLVEEVESCENVTKTDCNKTIVNCSIIYNQNCQFILQKIPKNIIKEECQDLPQPPKCEIELREKCHRELVPIVKTSPKEICGNQTKEECVDNTIEESKKICVEKPKYTCRIENIPKKVIKKVKKCKIQNIKKCRMIYKEVCSIDSYSKYNCKNLPQTICREVPTKKCEFETIQEEKNVPQKVCKNEYIKDCRMIPVPIIVRDCKNITRPYCTTEYVETVVEVSKDVCVDEEVQKCSEEPLKKECKANMVTVYDDVEEEVCTESPNEVCDEKPSCKTFTEKVCSLKPIETTANRHVCTEEERPICELVEVDVCETIQRPIVKDIPKEQCQDVCEDKPETLCQIKMENKCKIVLVPKEVVVLVERCE
ncbi:uncharacterized protein [Lepeophtheirus salmonis]|uniref:uncharacterized protein n=1 Tax=Lepeophtheirus salmonis TaxID=72036 RepID=UPI001AE35C0A|nr:uncharacterized protein LOC121130236 [Lepeophtheirus salmonis]